MENTGVFHGKNGDFSEDTEQRKDCASEKNVDENVVNTPIEKPCVSPYDIIIARSDEPDELNDPHDVSVKPRIILTLRTSETDPEAYFSTSSIRENHDPKKRESLLSKCRNSNHDSTVVPASSDVLAVENTCKRTLRRMSNSKESVLQNAIALKEKSFGIPDSNFCKKSKSPKSTAEKISMKQSNITRSKSPKMLNSLSLPEKRSLQSSSAVEYDSNDQMIPAAESDKLDVPYCKSENIEVLNSTSVIVNTNGLCDSHRVSKENHLFNFYTKPMRKRKRYYKGLSYSFNPKRHQVKRKKLSERSCPSKYQNYDSSGQDTDSQNNDILSEEIGQPRDLKSKSVEVSNVSSQSVAVLLETATKMKQNFNTSMDFLNDRFNDDAPSPSTGDSPEKPARPESTMVTSNGTVAALCLCQVQERVYRKVDIDNKYHCQAIDSIEGKQVGCCNPVTLMTDGDIKLQRPSVKVTYLMFCDVHAHRLLIHNCCPTCGLFCTQGKFVVCASQHTYHRHCELLNEEKSICPHCGQLSPLNDTVFSIGQDKNPIFVPLQTSVREIPCAKMSVQGSVTSMRYSSRRSISPPTISSRSYTLPSGREITSEGLPITAIDGDKLNSLLSSGLSLITDNVAQKCSYRTMYCAAKTGDVEKVLACLAHGLNPNHLYRELVMGTVLHAASAKGYLTVVHILRQAGAQLDVLDKEQNTPIMLAAMNGQNEVLNYLIKAGANLSFKGKDGMTALHLSAKGGNLEGCFYLLSYSLTPSDYVNVVDDGGWTSLVWAAENNHLDILLFLLSKGADPLVRDSEHNVALHWAAYSGSVDTSDALLHFNSDINCTNVHGDTPLHVCARQEHYPCVILLLAQGARTDIRNVAGMLALDCCVNKPCDSYNAIKLNIQLKEMTARCREKTIKILTNDITKGHEQNPIQCVNAVDDEPMPVDFVYITENCFTSNIKVDRTITSLRSCSCTDSCNSISCTCGKLSLRCWYTDDGKLSSDFNFIEPPMIFECNSLCSCNKITCNNRVVQHGVTSRFQLFRTKEKGWGVITLRTILKGSYVCEYVGEIISDTEADTREDDSYLFDLDNKDGETYCIDAFRYGNIARFINHSCVPNLQPVKVFVNHQDLHFPRIAFFANRDIEPYEELGFDYGEKFWIIKYKSFTCTCGATSCRYSGKTIQATLDAYNKKLQMED